MTLLDFIHRFADNQSCLAFLAEQKWKDGFQCRRCNCVGHMNGYTPYAGRCKQCKYDESATAHTLFHHIKFPLVRLFLFAIVCPLKKGCRVMR